MKRFKTPIAEHEFNTVGDFEAIDAARDWCKNNDYSYGSMQRDAPIGLMKGDYDISKWRNMTSGEQYSLDGVMTGNFREGPVKITIYK